MTKETFIYGLNACAVTYHNGQKLYEHNDLIKCFEDLGIFEQDPKAVKVLKMRDATPEERKSIDKYIKSISKPTAVDFWDLEQESKTDISKLLDKTFDDFCKCEGGEGWLKIDDKEYNTDAGYALEGMRIFMEVFKQRLAESEDKE